MNPKFRFLYRNADQGFAKADAMTSGGGEARSNTIAKEDSMSNAMVGDSADNTAMSADDIEKLMSDAVNLRSGGGFDFKKRSAVAATK
jgi:hypothetical protein